MEDFYKRLGEACIDATIELFGYALWLLSEPLPKEE